MVIYLQQSHAPYYTATQFATDNNKLTNRKMLCSICHFNNHAVSIIRFMISVEKESLNAWLISLDKRATPFQLRSGVCASCIRVAFFLHPKESGVDCSRLFADYLQLIC